jgi:hypothetical protein
VLRAFNAGMEKWLGHGGSWFRNRAMSARRASVGSNSGAAVQNQPQSTARDPLARIHTAPDGGLQRPRAKWVERATRPFRSATRRPEEPDDKRRFGMNFDWHAHFHSFRRVAGRHGPVARSTHSASHKL